MPQNSTDSETKRGFRAPCLKCGELGVRVSLANTAEFTCTECGVDFTANEVRETIDTWASVLEWIACAPPCEE